MLCQVYACRRKLYNQTGSLEDSEELAGEQFEELYNYYRGLYRKVSMPLSLLRLLQSLLQIW